MARLTEQDRDRLERQYRFFVHPILESLKRVKKVVAHIHKIEISTTLLADDIKLSTGENIETDPIDKGKEKNSYYTKKKSFDYFGLKGFVKSYPFNDEKKNDGDDDEQNYIRASIISITPKGYIDPKEHKKLLLKLQNDLRSGDVIVRYVELTLDIFPEKKNLVPSLFESLAKIIYVPYIRNKNDIVFDGGQLFRVKTNKKRKKKLKEVVERLNRVIKFKDQYKLYERSDDDKHVKISFKENGFKRSVKAYRKKDLNRVRFEQNLSRDKLRRKGITTLTDLANHTNPDGVNILHNLFEVPKFNIIDTGPKKFDYVCLMSTINQMKHKQGYHHDLRRLHGKSLRSKINKAIIEHSEKWRFDPTDIRSYLRGKK